MPNPAASVAGFAPSAAAEAPPGAASASTEHDFAGLLGSDGTHPAAAAVPGRSAGHVGGDESAPGGGERAIGTLAALRLLDGNAGLAGAAATRSPAAADPAAPDAGEQPHGPAGGDPSEPANAEAAAAAGPAPLPAMVALLTVAARLEAATAGDPAAHRREIAAMAADGSRPGDPALPPRAPSGAPQSLLPFPAGGATAEAAGECDARQAPASDAAGAPGGADAPAHRQKTTGAGLLDALAFKPDGGSPAIRPLAAMADPLALASAAAAASGGAGTAGAGAAPAAPLVLARADDAAAGIPLGGVPIEIAARASAGKRRFEIRLDPPELGRIDVRLDLGRDGQVTSRLVVERAETLDLLRRDAAALERALQSAGLRPDDAGLQFSLRDQQPGRWSGFEPPRRPQLLIVPDQNVAVQEAVRRGYGALRGLGRGVDISV